ncbi:MAG: hypothetical protein OXB86_06390 [Bdellovibrionales bacterium]|nr:hypothetical protein [Bdellovibrionales bacterium]
MELKFQSFGGKIFRPQPEVLVHKELGLFAVVTPWGPQFQTKEVLSSLIQNYETYSSDEEVTAVYSPLNSLSPEENVFRQAVLSCNEQVFKEQNKESEYTFGYEMVCGVVRQQQILFIQVGHPYIYLDRSDIPLQPMGHVLDLASGFSRLPQNPPPLPSQLLGLYSDMHFSVFRLPVEKTDRLLFISRSFIPVSVITAPRKERTLNRIARCLAEDNQNIPFWIGLLDLTD